MRDLLESDTVADDRAASARAEWRAEEAEWSRVALEHWEHGRGLADVLRDCMQCGDTVTFAFSTVTWSGSIGAVGRDIVRVDVGEVTVDVRLDPAAPFVLRARSGAGEGAFDRAVVTTFAARLRELDGTAVCIGTSSGTLEGDLRVGRDQVRVTASGADVAYVPTGSVWWVRPLDDD